MAVQKCVIVFIILRCFQIVPASELNVSVVLGQTAHLPCNCSMNKDFVGIKFTRHEPPKDQYVFFARDGRSDETRQDPQYSNRVNWTQDGILHIHNVTQSDEGTFECIVSYPDPDPESEDAEEVQCPVNLTVKDGNNTRRPELKPPGPAGEDVGFKEKLKPYKILFSFLSLFFIFILIFLCPKIKKTVNLTNDIETGFK